MDKRVEILQDLMKDEGFVKELFSKESPEEIQALFESKDVEFTLDEIKQIGEMLAKIQSGDIDAKQLEKAASGELSEDELESVAGGSAIAAATIVIALVAGGGSAYGTYELVTHIDAVVDWFKKW